MPLCVRPPTATDKEEKGHPDAEDLLFVVRAQSTELKAKLRFVVWFLRFDDVLRAVSASTERFVASFALISKQQTILFSIKCRGYIHFALMTEWKLFPGLDLLPFLFIMYLYVTAFKVFFLKSHNLSMWVCMWVCGYMCTTVCRWENNFQYWVCSLLCGSQWPISGYQAWKNHVIALSRLPSPGGCSLHNQAVRMLVPSWLLWPVFCLGESCVFILYVEMH